VTTRPILLLCAMGPEAGAVERAVAGMPFPTPVVNTGVGKVAAAMNTQAGIDRHNPAGIVFVGVSGALAPDLHVMDAMIGTDAVQWDVDLTAFGSEPGQLNDGRRFIRMDELGTRLALEAAQDLGVPARPGRIASGDTFLADPNKSRWIRETFGADTVEMEGAAAAQVADDRGIPIVIIRVVSDSAGSEAELSFEEFLPKASERAAAIVKGFLKAWAEQLPA
jgi:5'-methylthioadenosine/S-adenosylhomocysteine nucleosidase